VLTEDIADKPTSAVESVHDLAWTGERYVPQVSGDIALEHLHRYAVARELAGGKNVLDIACGEGYGAALISAVANQVIGVDISNETITHAATRYKRPNLRFKVGSCAQIPLPDSSVDLVVSFETIEHHDQHREMMKEIKRILRPDGVVLISSPDKYQYSDVPGYKNEFHVKELYLNEFEELLKGHFRNVSILGQRVVYGSFIAPLVSSVRPPVMSFHGDARNIRRNDGVSRPVYFIGLASDGALPPASAGVFEGAGVSAETVAQKDCRIGELPKHVVALQGIIAERDGQLNRILSSRSWRLTKPLRFVGRLLRGDLDAALAPLRRRVAEGNGGSGEPRGLSLCPLLPVAVILPVYRGVEMTVACIEAAMPGILDIPGSKMVAINDASPDSGMQEALEAAQRRWPDAFCLLINERNAGFVATVNRGLRQFSEHDYVLLNSDVIVPANWLRRLREDAYSRSGVATVTPISNNTTICTFPEFLQNNAVPFGLAIKSVDAFFAERKLECVEAPTGIGFCMYIRNEALVDVGLPDEARFGRGYGEENDFCQRALKKGYVNLISPNLYCYHEGGISFGAEKAALVDNALRTIDSLHPNYHGDVQAFITADPLRSARVTRFTSLLAGISLPKIVHVSHGIGGGVDQHIEELADIIKDKAASLLLAPADGETCVELRLGVRKTADSLYFNMPGQFDKLVALLRGMGISLVHFHHLLRLHPILHELPKALSVDHLLTIHDYYLLNGSPTLTDKDSIFPGYYDDSIMNPLSPLPDGVTPGQWRERHRSIVESAKVVIFPSQSARTLFADMYAFQRPAIISWHPEHLRNTHADLKPLGPKKRYVIGVIGAISREKGADLLEELAQLAHATSKPFDFVLIGYAYRRLKRLKTTGPYVPQALPCLLAEHGVDICLFPARWPETYSYTLSQALDAGLPIAAPAIGAFTERLSGRKGSWLFDHLMPAEMLLAQLESFVHDLVTDGVGCRQAASTAKQQVARDSFYPNEYLDLVPVVHPSTSALVLDSGVLDVRRRRIARERILVWLWRLYSHRSMRWVDRVIPFYIRRAVKRRLSRQALHDLR
jgi:ubiquinone/menaquinone biosynthesis C-methylase UbiE/GT2 family glycosyltransferase/glycosyltransferase involved in cell wall biosynthesis